MKIALVGPVFPYRGGISLYNTLLYRELSKEHNVQAINFRRGF